MLSGTSDDSQGPAGDKCKGGNLFHTHFYSPDQDSKSVTKTNTRKYIQIFEGLCNSGFSGRSHTSVSALQLCLTTQKAKIESFYSLSQII